jgi:hypothetical protein
MARLLNQLRSSKRICAVVDFSDHALLYQFFDLFLGLAHERDYVGPRALVEPEHAASVR